MRPETMELVYIDHSYTGHALTHHKSTNNLSNGFADENILSDVLQRLLEVFDSVHLCSQGSEAVELLKRRDAWNPQATMVLVPVDNDLDVADASILESGIAGEPIGLTTQSAAGLRGIQLLTFLNAECRRRKLPYIVTAAIVPESTTAIFQKLIDIGTTDCIQLPITHTDAQRLAAAIYRKFRKRTYTQRFEIPDDSGKYERPDTIPSEQEWNALHTRVQNIYLQDLTNNQRMLDHHMPVPEPIKIPSDDEFSDAKHLANVARLQNIVSTWSFKSLELTDDDLIMCSIVMFKHVLQMEGNERWHISDRKLYEFLVCTRALYHSSNSYHNFRHAVDVQQALFFFMLSAGAFPRMNKSCAEYEPVSEQCAVMRSLFSPQHILAALIVGIGHDVGHPGVTNAFLTSTKSPLAIMYNDRSVLENLHCAALGRTLAKTWPAAQDFGMRRIIMELVLATDMALHFDYMSRYKEMETLTLQRRAANDKSTINEPMLEKCKITLFSALVKCADISNVARPFDISMDWSIALLREFFNQGRLEAALGMPVTPMLNPANTVQASSQIFFIDMFAIPLFKALEIVLPSMNQVTEVLAQNRRTWQSLGQTQSQTPTAAEVERPPSPRKKPLDKITALFKKRGGGD